MSNAYLMMLRFEEMSEPLKIYGTRDKADADIARVKALLTGFYAECEKHESERSSNYGWDWMPDTAQPFYDELLDMFPVLKGGENQSPMLEGLSSMHHGGHGSVETQLEYLFRIEELPADL